MASKSCKKGSFHKLFTHKGFTVFLLFTTLISVFLVYCSNIFPHNHIDLPPKGIFYKKQQLSDDLWLYVTVLECNATSPNYYSYFLAKEIDGNPLEKLSGRFLVGDRGDAEVSFKEITQKVGENRFSHITGDPIDPEETEEIPYVMVKYSGRVFVFTNRVAVHDLKNHKTSYPNIKIEASSGNF